MVCNFHFLQELTYLAKHIFWQLFIFLSMPSKPEIIERHLDHHDFPHGFREMTRCCNEETINGKTHMFFKYSISLFWFSDPDQTPIINQDRSVFDKLLNHKILADCSIIASNQTEIKCHRCILAASSEVFHAMLTNNMEESQTSKIEMNDISEEAVNALLVYLYQRVSFDMRAFFIENDVAFELLRTAHKYNIRPLEDLMKEKLSKIDPISVDINVVLELYFFAVNVDSCKVLGDKMLIILKT